MHPSHGPGASPCQNAASLKHRAEHLKHLCTHALAPSPSPTKGDGGGTQSHQDECAICLDNLPRFLLCVSLIYNLSFSCLLTHLDVPS